MKNIAAAFMILITTGNAHAMLVSIDFQPSGSTLYTGQGILGGSGDTTWNAVDIGGAANLTLADGSGLSAVGVSTGGFTNSYENLTSTTYPASNTLLADRITYLTSEYTATSFTLTGLTPGSLYNIVVQRVLCPGIYC